MDIRGLTGSQNKGNGMEQSKGDLSQKLKRVVKGAATVSAGDLLSRALQLILTIIVIRILAPEQYGLLNLGLTVVGIATLVATLGFPAGIPRFVARLRGEASLGGVLHVGVGALTASVLGAMILSGLMFAGARFIAETINKPALYWVLGVLIISIPANVAIRTLTAIFRGMEIARAKIWFEDIGSNITKLILLVPIIALGMGFSQLIWIYVMGPWIICSLYGIYFVKHFRGLWSTLSVRPILNKGAKLMFFSLPLLGAGLLANGMAWTGSLTVGHMRPLEEVGFFSAALRLASLLPLPLSAMMFLYLPIATKASVSGSSSDWKEFYTSTTKWSFFFTLPITIYLLADAEFIVAALFGDAYREVANVLRAIVVGFVVNTLLGPNGMTLVALGDSRTSFLAAIIAVVSTVALCFLLVPAVGVIGAGLGVGLGHAASNVYISVVLYREWGIHPFARHYTLPILMALPASLVIVFLFWVSQWQGAWPHLLLLALLCLTAVVSPVVTRTVTKADLAVLAAVERKLTSRQAITDRIVSHMRKHSPRAFI